MSKGAVEIQSKAVGSSAEGGTSPPLYDDSVPFEEVGVSPVGAKNRFMVSLSMVRGGEKVNVMQVEEGRGGGLSSGLTRSGGGDAGASGGNDR